MRTRGNSSNNTTTEWSNATVEGSQWRGGGINGNSRHSQSRASRYRQSGGRYLQEVSRKIKAFRHGTDKYKRKICPSRADILRAAAKEAEEVESGEAVPSFDPKVDNRLREERAVVRELLQANAKDSRGFIPATKPPDALRFFMGNMNSLSLYDQSRSWKVTRLKETNKRYQTDGMLLQETGVDFRQVPEEFSFPNLLGDQDVRVATANNVTEDSARYQAGGVASVLMARLASFVLGWGRDPTGLGRWVWFLVGTGSRCTIIVVAYRPCKPSKSTRKDFQRGMLTVWSQQRRYLRKRGLRGSPRARFAADLLRQLKDWQRRGREIILFMDLNECAYTGELALALTGEDLGMQECFQQVNHHRAPPSHFRGSKPITGCFITAGIDCLNCYVSPHQTGPGDHRYWMVDFCAKSILGVGYPHLVRPRGRRLKCCVERTAIKYTRKLRQLTEEHRMYEKMDALLTRPPETPREDLARSMNKWDSQHIEHQACAENNCNSFFDGTVEFSPEVNVWFKRKNIYTQLQSILRRRSQGKRANTSNFLRSCQHNGIVDPFSLSIEDAAVCIAACESRIKELTPIAPALRNEHMMACMSAARERGNRAHANRIRVSMNNERSRKRWSGVRRSTKPRSGGAPTAIKIKTDEEDLLFDTQSGVEQQASRKLTDRFKLARGAPISSGQLFDDVGYLGDSTSTRAILEGTYEFPPEMDPHTRMICEEAHRIFILKSTEEVCNFVTTDDYQFFWSQADEFIQSSYSNIHFGHYKAIARDRYLSALQAAKLSLAARTGIPMDRWGSALTVLLEKEFGNIYLDKMRAICLMEADFNWLMKLVFAKRMMDQAYDAGIIPVEQFARRGTQAAHGVLCKVLFCDMTRALHLIAGLPSVDLGNCYDAVSHPIASIAMQALKVPLMTVVLALSVLQTMTFYLRTGYGVSQQGYGGSPDDPTFGLGQGNGMAPSGFSAVSTLMIETYKRLGHASEFCGAWSGIMFLLAAIIYVDDTDLLLVARSRDMHLNDFFQQTQSAVMDWGFIVQATGGYLKSAKCFWYMMAWHWHKGVPTLRSLRQLPKYQLMIPQQDGSRAPVKLRDVNDPQETLGVYSCPAGDFSFHIECKMEKGKKWVERLRRSTCPPADGWMGFRYALIPSLTYGFSAICPKLDLLEDSFQALYRNVLSPLRVNMNIKTFYRMAPKRYQGLGMPNPGIVMLSQKLHLLQSQLDQPTATGMLLKQSLEVFQMEVGLSTNILMEDYNRLSNLASDGWWKHFWQLCHKFNVTISLTRRWLIPLLRHNDRSLMDVICGTDLYSPSDRAAFNRVRKFKGLHSLADLTLVDGKTVDPFVFTRDPSDSSRVFSVEKPTRKDFSLFWQMIKNLCGGGRSSLTTTLGNYIGQPHRRDVWFVSEDRSELYRVENNTSYQLYTLSSTHRQTRCGSRYSFSAVIPGQCDRSIRASVSSCPRDEFIMVVNATCPVYLPSSSRQSFLQRLHSLPNQTLWRTFQTDGDGSWIYCSLLAGNLIIMSDGSYNENIALDVCSCATVFRDKITNDSARVTWAEKSNAHTADNYRAELLGAIAIQLILKVASDGKYIPRDLRPQCGCDNKTVVYHGNHPRRPMPEKQAQADLLRYYKRLVRDAPYKCQMYHVYGHLDQYLSLDELTIEELTNIECDEEADIALVEGVRLGRYIDRVLPDEDFVVKVDGEKLSGPTLPAINRHWGRTEAREHYHDQGILDRDLFDEVDWDSTERVMTRAPEMFSVWVTKQVSGFCGSNHMLNHIYGDVVDRCPNCGASPERSNHMLHCRDPDRAALFASSVHTLVEWLHKQQTDFELILLIKQYLLARGDRTMLSLCHPNSIYRQLAYMHDQIGYDNFLEGRISSLFRSMRQRDISDRNLRKHAGHWCNGLVLHLLQITHRQWTYRCQTVHYKAADGLTEEQQRKIMRDCEDLIWTDPSILLPEDRPLLHIDFESLGNSPAIMRQLWISEMEAATVAARCESARQEEVIWENEQREPLIDTEGSIRFRRRRKRSNR